MVKTLTKLSDLKWNVINSCEWLWTLNIKKQFVPLLNTNQQFTTCLLKPPNGLFQVVFPGEITIVFYKNWPAVSLFSEIAESQTAISMLSPLPRQQLIELILTQGRAVCGGRWFAACLSEWRQGGSSSHKTDLWKAWQSSVIILLKL